MKKVSMAAALLTLPLLSACGNDTVTRPPAVSGEPVVSIAGTYTGFPFWLIQVVRTNDNFTTSFNCQGTMTISQSPGSNGVASLSGFAVVGSPCPPLSFPLSGTLRSDGTITIITGGPRPPEGPCPPAVGAEYSGLATANSISARGSATVQCPEFGEHKFSYIISARKSN
jgi:hypothetical protein